MTDARENILRKLLHTIASEQKYENPDIETDAIPTTGANFTSQLFHATIKAADKENLNVFAKVAVVGEILREQAGNNVFEIEPYFYINLAKKYKEIEDKYEIPEEHRLIVPQFYGHSEVYLEEVLVLQDLSKEGFITYDRLKSVDWDYASKCIEELAKLHALSIAYQKEYPEEYEKGKNILKRQPFPEDGPVQAMLKQMLEQVIQMIKDENKPKLQNFFSEIFNKETFTKFYTTKLRPVIIHSDFRQSNIMHKIDEDGKVRIVIVDYQTLHPGSVAMDLLYFIFTGSDGAFRAQYYDQLIEHYYENLVAALRRLNLNPEEVFPRSVFDEELKEMLPFGLLVANMLLPMVTIDLVHVTAASSEFENHSFEAIADMVSNTNALCAQRLNEVVDDYVKWGVI